MYENLHMRIYIGEKALIHFCVSVFPSEVEKVVLFANIGKALKRM